MKDIKSKFTDETYFNGIKYYLQDFKLNYRAVIPLYILLDPSLSANELRFYGIIEQMESSLTDVFLTDRAIAYILGINHESKIVQRMLRKLKDKNYLKREEREVTIGKKKAWLKCWNTVKGGVILNDKTGVPDVHRVDCNNTAGVPDVHGGGVPDVHGGGVPDVHPCNALISKTLETSVCGKNTPPTDHTHTNLSLLTTDPECLKLFSDKFSKYDVTIEQLAEACMSHYSSITVHVFKFKGWIRNEKLENHVLKRIRSNQVSEEDQDIFGAYKHALELGKIEIYFKDPIKRENAKQIYERYKK